MHAVKRTRIDEGTIDRLLGMESSKIGFYSDVKQKIQELEAANLNLRTKQNELQAIFDAIGDGVAIFDANGFIQHRNHVCPRLFPMETMLGSSCRWLFHPERERHTHDDCIVEAALHGDSRNLAFTTSDNGRARYFEASATPIEDSHGKHRALVFLREVTDRRLQELQLMQSEKMACMGLLAAGVAHEINNPLTSVAGYAEALIRRFREDPDLAADQRLEVFQRYLEVIIRESYRCKGIINSLLTFSRKSDGSVGIVNINEIVREVLELVRPKATAEKVDIEDRLALDLPHVRGDAAGLRQVFMNLVMNALQAIEGAGRIILTSYAEDRKVLIKVKDSGCGIPKVLLEQIWDPFFTTKTVGQGVGLGLAVTYNIVHRHGGEILVETREHEGACFTVRLPS